MRVCQFHHFGILIIQKILYHSFINIKVNNFHYRGCERIRLTIWSPRFEASARRDEVGVPSAAHNRGATPQWSKDGTLRRARALLGCDCGAHRLRSALATRRSSLLVSLQNRLWQMLNLILSQPHSFIFTLFHPRSNIKKEMIC